MTAYRYSSAVIDPHGLKTKALSRHDRVLEICTDISLWIDRLPMPYERVCALDLGGWE